MRTVLQASALYLLLGVGLGGCLMYVRWEANAQGEIYDPTTGDVNWALWLGDGLVGFLLGVPVATLAFVVGPLDEWRRRRAERRARDEAAG